MGDATEWKQIEDNDWPMLRPPNDRESDVKLHRIYREVCKDNKQCAIIGDFNHRTIDWDIPRAEHVDQEFLEAVQDCYLTQHVREPTRGETY